MICRLVPEREAIPVVATLQCRNMAIEKTLSSRQIRYRIIDICLIYYVIYIWMHSIIPSTYAGSDQDPMAVEP